MNIAFGCDHAGFPLKETVIDIVKKAGHSVLDLGTFSLESVDYPDFAAAVARAVVNGEAERGLVVCGSGVGASIAANKIKGARACLCHDIYSAHQGVEHDDMNILCLGARIIGAGLANDLILAFLNAQFQPEERFVRRLNKVIALEQD